MTRDHFRLAKQAANKEKLKVNTLMPEQLQKAIDDYHALMARDLDAADEQVAALRQMQIERKVTFGPRPLADSLRPTFLTEATYNAVQDTVYLIRQAILLIAAAFFNDERVLKQELGLEDWEIELAAMPTNVIRMAAMSRMDSFMTKDSSWPPCRGWIRS